MPALIVLLFALLVVALGWLALRLWQALVRPGALFTTVYDWEHGLLYVDGRFERVLPAGRYWTLSGLRRREIFTLRRTEQLETVALVDVTSADRFVFRAGATVSYRIVEPREAFENGFVAKIRLA